MGLRGGAWSQMDGWLDAQSRRCVGSIGGTSGVIGIRAMADVKRGDRASAQAMAAEKSGPASRGGRATMLILTPE